MVRDYVEQMYEPTAGRTCRLAEDKHARARALADWKQRVVAAWEGVRVEAVETDAATRVADLGATRTVEVLVSLGQLSSDDVAVELLHGPVGPSDELVSTSRVPLQLAGQAPSPGQYRYQGSFTCERAGRYGIAVRVVPAHPDLAVPAEMGCVAWA
jgi:starch phosphorylase